MLRLICACGRDLDALTIVSRLPEASRNTTITRQQLQKITARLQCQQCGQKGLVNVIEINDTPTSTPVKPRKVKFWGTEKSVNHVFHKPDCPWLEGVNRSNLVDFFTFDEALRRGFRPCMTCKPKK